MLRIGISCMVALPSLGLSTTSTSSLVRFTQSLSNSNHRFEFVFFNANRFTKVNFRQLFALKKPVTFVTGYVARPGFEPGSAEGGYEDFLRK